MNPKIESAHSHIEGPEVAAMILDFWIEFRDVYPLSVTESSLCAVGPLQSMIGLAIKNGRLHAADHPTPPHTGKE